MIGKDTRRSSYMLEYSLVSGLTAAGADAYIMHVTTTASVSYITRTDGFDCGIMISASHNPFYDNGIKLMGPGGEKLDDDVIAELERYLGGERVPRCEREVCGADMGRTIDYVCGRNRYIGHLISLSACSFKGMRVGLDCANGSAWQIAKSVFDALGAVTYVIGASPDGLNINESGSTGISALCELVGREGLDAGFAFDGDADRCIAVDERGNAVDGDGELYILAGRLAELGELGRAGVVCTVMSNSALISSLAARGIACSVSGVGDRQVSKKMCRTGARLGGEKSGHIIISKYGVSGDGLVTAVKLLEAAADRGASLSQLLRGYEPLPQHERSVPVQDKEEAFGKGLLAECERLKRAEGCTRVVARPSGTEPVIRLMAEGNSDEACLRCLDGAERYLKCR